MSTVADVQSSERIRFKRKRSAEWTSDGSEHVAHSNDSTVTFIIFILYCNLFIKLFFSNKIAIALFFAGFHRTKIVSMICSTILSTSRFTETRCINP